MLSGKKTKHHYSFNNLQKQAKQIHGGIIRIVVTFEKEGFWDARLHILNVSYTGMIALHYDLCVLFCKYIYTIFKT